MKSSDSTTATAASTRQLATVTILDGVGDATVVRGSTRFALAEGVKLHGDDIVETGIGTRLLRYETADGDFFDLGPSTRLMLAPTLLAGRSAVPARAYLLQGWVKWTVAQAPATGALLSASLDVQGVMHSAVISRLEDGGAVFAETGDLTVVERRNGRGSPRLLKSHGFLAQAGNGAQEVAARPSPQFLARLPPTFADSLPSRIALFARERPARPIGEIEYPEAQPWIDAEPALRHNLVPRWRSRADVQAFRRGLVADLPAHPEWDRTLYPEKYAEKPVAKRATVVSSTNPSPTRTP